ncbi:MAG: type I methionyl aminopeptidase [Patescibacteria group bacterium]
MIKLKTKKDILSLREAGKVHNEILGKLEKYCVPGVSTKEIDEEAARLIEKAGMEAAFLGYKPKGASRPFPASLCVSVNEEIVHGIPNEDPRVIKEGDLVSLDLGLFYKGVVTDAAVSVCVGNCSRENRDMNTQTQKALEKGIEAMSPGGNIGDIGAAISVFARKTSFSLVRYLCGHGVGYSVHEDPFVPNVNRKGEGPVLEEGLVIAIEPMLTSGSGEIVLDENGFTYLTREGTTSAHWEHTVAVTEKGIEIITE